MNKERDHKSQFSSIEVPDSSDKITDHTPFLSQGNINETEKTFPVENTEDVIKYSHLLLEGSLLLIFLNVKLTAYCVIHP